MAERMMAAAGLFAERGLDATKMEDIAEATGTPKATLYYYFAAKEDILVLLFEEVLGRVRGAVTEAAAGHGDALARLRRVIGAHLGVYRDYPMASLALHFELGRAARAPQVLDQAERSFIDPVSSLIADGVAAGTLRPVRHPRLVATALLGMITTTGANAIATRPGRDVDEVSDEIASLVLMGLSLPVQVT